MSRPSVRAAQTVGRTADRGTLCNANVDAFVAWAESRGFRREPSPKAAKYEALRLRHPDGGAPILFFRRERANFKGGAPEHLSCDARGVKLVRAWLQSRRDTCK